MGHVYDLNLFFEGMFSAYQAREELEDELYDDGDSEVSDVCSELEFHLYSQLHYSSNAAEMVELVDDEEENDRPSLGNQKHDMLETTGDGENKMLLQQGSKRSSSNNNKKKKRKKNKTPATDHKSSPLPVDFEEVIVIDSGPEVISISDDETSNEGICALKAQGSRKLQTSTPSQQVKDSEIKYLKLHSSSLV